MPELPDLPDGYSRVEQTPDERTREVVLRIKTLTDGLFVESVPPTDEAQAQLVWQRNIKTADVMGLVMAERRRQDAKWGEQNHPDLDPMAVASWSVADHYDLRGATAARAVVTREAVVVEHGPSWLAILLEEVSEVAEAAENGDEVALEAELVQVAAAAVAQVEHLRRRRAARRAELTAAYHRDIAEQPPRG